MLLVILCYLLMVTVLVVAHEFGHYIVARWFKMEVEEFAIGFGRPYWTYARKNGTEYTLRPFPLGGFVRVKGMVPEEDGSETKVENGFYSRGPWPRFWMLLAGPAASMLAGSIILASVWGTFGKEELDHSPIIGQISETGASYKAGIRPGDKILSVNGTPTPTFYNIVENVRDLNGKDAVIEYERDGKKTTVTVKPRLDTEPSPVMKPDLTIGKELRKQSKIGIGNGTKREPIPIGEALGDAFKAPFVYSFEMLRLFTQPKELIQNVGGPETMVRLTKAHVDEDFLRFLEYAGNISMSLGFFNLLPIAPLDGGQIVVSIAEMFRRGRRLSFKAQSLFQGVGLSLVLLMVVSFVTLDRIRWSKISAEQAKLEAEQKIQKK